MPHFNAFRTPSFIATEQPHRRTQNSRGQVVEKYQQTNLYVALTPFQPKRVKDLVNEGVRAWLCGKLAVTDKSTHCSNRGSDHDFDLERLADMIYGYGIVDQDGSHQDRSSANFETDCEVAEEGSSSGDNFMPSQPLLCDILEDVCSRTSTGFELCLLRNVEKAIAIDKGKASFNVHENAEQKSRSRGFVMNSLRLAGYNAGVCKSRWERTIGHLGGSYEIVDVVIEGAKLKNERFFVDIAFMAQFEIARPTTSYNDLLQKLPTLFVGKADKLCSVKIMCDAGRRCLKEKEMYIPRWRKYRYMQNKWLASYKRTSNPAAARAAENALFQFPYPSMELQAMTSNARVLVDQREKGNVASEKNLTSKSKYIKQSNERFETRDLFLKIIGDPERHVNRISKLSTALAEAGLTTMIPLKS